MQFQYQDFSPLTLLRISLTNAIGDLRVRRNSPSGWSLSGPLACSLKYETSETDYGNVTKPDEITYQSLSWLCRCITPNVLSHDMEESRASDAHRTTILPFMPKIECMKCEQCTS